MVGPAEVRLEVCREVASVLEGTPIPDDAEDKPLPGIPRSGVPNFYFYLVAICHQTSPAGLPGLRGVVGGQIRRGWDYLCARFEVACALDPSRLSPSAWSKESEGTLVETFYGSDDGTCRLVGLRERARLVRNLGSHLQADGISDVQELFERCSGSVDALLVALGRFAAYDDPVQKKSIFFLSLMRNTGLWSYVDANALGAPVDYHEIRGHLRLGTVVIVDPALAERVLRGAEIDTADDVKIRLAVREAIEGIARLRGVSASQAHYLFWNVFRCVCIRESPLCLDVGTSNPLPERYRHLVGLRASGGCPFGGVCRALRVGKFPTEYRVSTCYY